MKASRSSIPILIFFATLVTGVPQPMPNLSLAAVTNIPCDAQALAVSGHYLYAAGGELQIFDLSDPANPVDVGYNNGLGNCSAVVVTGGYVYALQNGLQIFDNSNPTNPVAVGHIVGAWTDVTVDSRHVFLNAAVIQPNVSIYDVSTPAKPVSLGQIQTISGWPTPVAVSGSYAYVANNFAGLLVSDISDPANPVTIRTNYDFNPFWNVIASGGFAYTAVATNSLAIYSISSPANPTGIFFRAVEPTCYSLALYGNYLLAAAGWLMTSLDISNPTNTVIAAQQDLSPFTYVASLHAIAASRGYVYSAGRGYLSVISLGVSSAPSLGIVNTHTNTAILSWPTPSFAFSVQQNPGLNPSNWVTLTNQSVVVGSQNQVTIPTGGGTRFYRLILQ
jgi:hypothetical protein